MFTGVGVAKAKKNGRLQRPHPHQPLTTNNFKSIAPTITTKNLLTTRLYFDTFTLKWHAYEMNMNGKKFKVARVTLYGNEMSEHDVPSSYALNSSTFYV